MSRCWAVLPVIVTAGVPVWTDPSAIVVAIAGAAATVCLLGLLTRFVALVTAGAAIGAAGYAVAATGAAGGADIVAATVFGLALLALLDLSEFARRTHGVAVAAAALRDQVTYWFARAGIIAAATAALLLLAAALATAVPGPGRAIVAGAGAVIAFAGAVRAGIGRPDR